MHNVSIVTLCVHYYVQIENHDVDNELMEKVKVLMKSHYECSMKPAFLGSETTRILDNNRYVGDRDWESTFFVCHRPNNTINDVPALSEDLR